MSRAELSVGFGGRGWRMGWGGVEGRGLGRMGFWR